MRLAAERAGHGAKLIALVIRYPISCHGLTRMALGSLPS